MNTPRKLTPEVKRWLDTFIRIYRERFNVEPTPGNIRRMKKGAPWRTMTPDQFADVIEREAARLNAAGK